MEKFNSGEKLIKDFGWQGFQYFAHMQKGLLQPYTVTGRRIIDPNTEHGKKIIENFKQLPPKTLEEYEKIERRRKIRFWEQHGGMPRSNKFEQRIKEEARIHYNFHLMEQNGCIQKSFTLSRVEKEASKQFREAKKWLFKEDEVLDLKKEHGLERAVKHTPSDPPEPVGEPGVLSTNIEKDCNVLYDNAFKLVGSDWHIKYKGKDGFPVKDLKGIRYIVFLLANQDKEFDPLKLESLFDGLPSDSNETDSDTIQAIKRMDDEQLEKEGLYSSMDELPAETLTIEERGGLKSIVSNAWKRSKSGKTKDVEAFEKCKSYLEKEHGIFVIKTKRGDLKFKLKYRLKADAERTRKNISKNIKYAIKKIEEKNKNLAEFLSGFIHTGNLIRYTPSDIINWHIEK